MQYVKLNEKKTPIEKLSAGGHPLEEVEDFDNLGVLIPEPMIVFDFDSPSDAKIIQEIVEELDIHCNMMKTTRGVHLWFKSDEPMKNLIKTRCAIGLYYDIRSWGKICFTVVKKDGEWREWLRTYKADELDTVPAWLRPLSFSKFKFKEMKDGDGRNQALYEYILVMQQKGYNREQIRKTIKIINRFVFQEPLDDSEISVILRDESFKSDEDLAVDNSNAYFDEDGKFKHNIFANALIHDMKIVTMNDSIYVYEDGYYKPYAKAGRSIERRMIEMYPKIRTAQRSEVLNYIQIQTCIKPEDVTPNEYIINLKNTRFDLRTNKPLPFDSSIIDFTRIPVNYDPNAYCADLDKCLNKTFCGDREVINLFEEMVGYMLIKNCRFRKGFLCYGGGSNSKSTILNLLKRFIGESNCSTVEMEKLSEKFKTAELENKLVNIGDDINRKDITDTGLLKKLFTGESVTVERKNGHPFTLKSYAKLIFSCNEIPRIADKTHGMYSRLMLIPFTAQFSSDDEDFDPFIEDKITTDDALSYLLNMGLRGLRRLLANNDFTYPTVVKKALEDYKTNNSTVLTWVAEENIGLDMLMSDTTDRLFSEFKDWCNRSDIKFGASIRTFHKEIEEKYNLTRIRTRKPNGENNERSWKFVVNLD